MTAAGLVEPLAVTAAGAVSPDGHAAEGADAVAAVLGDEAPPPRALATVGTLPRDGVLGGRGTRELDRTTRLGLVACDLTLGDLAVPLSPEDRRRVGVAIGTSTGSVRASSEFSRETLIREKPHLVRAGLFPSAVMNCAASQVAIRFGLRGVNATLAGGKLSSFAAVRYARTALRAGHARAMVVGGVEELSPQSAWAWHRSHALAPGVAVGEGAAVLVVEPGEEAAAAGRAPRAQLLACEVGPVAAGGGRLRAADALAATIRRALARSAVDAAEIGLVALGCAGERGLRRLEERAVAEAVGDAPRRIDVAARAGVTFSAGGALQIAAVLDEGHGATALVVSLDVDGTPAALVVRTTELGGS